MGKKRMSETAVIVYDDLPIEFKTDMGMKELHHLSRGDVTGFLEAVITEQWQYNMLLGKDIGMKDLETLLNDMFAIITAARK